MLKKIFINIYYFFDDLLFFILYLFSPYEMKTDDVGAPGHIFIRSENEPAVTILDYRSYEDRVQHPITKPEFPYID